MPSPSSAVPGDFAIESLFRKVLRAIESGSSGGVETLWAEFERALAEHFADEEATVLVDLLAARPREARLILEEHRYLRGRLAQLRESPGSLSSETARTFLDELHAHGQHEDRLLRRWIESRVPATASKNAI